LAADSPTVGLKSGVAALHAVLTGAVPLIAVLCCVLFAGALPSVASAAELQKLSIGYQGMGRLGAWLPVSIQANDCPAGQAVTLQVTTADARSNLCTEIVAHGQADADGAVMLSGYVRPGRFDSPVVVQLVSSDDSGSAVVHCEHQIRCREADGKTGAEDEVAAVQQQLNLWRHDVRFLLTVGEVAGIEELLRNAALVSEGRPLVVGIQAASLEQMPADSFGFDAVDILVLTDRFDLSTKQLVAVKGWLQEGGHLIVSSGASVSSLVTTEFGRWLKQQFGLRDTSVEVQDLSALQSLVPGASRLETNRRSVRMAVTESGQPRVLAEALNGPLVSRMSNGAGVMTFVAVDLNTAPVSRWISLPQLYGMLMYDQTLTSSSGAGSRGSRISSTGVTDLSTQLMASVDYQSDTGRWSTWGIMGMVVGYLLLIGPCDYVLVTFGLKRPHLTWVSFPLLVILGCVGIFQMKDSGGPEASVAQVHILDVTQDGEQHRLLGRSWMSLSSSTTRRCSVNAVPSAELAGDGQVDAGSWMSWAGRPEDVYGGLYRVGGVSLGRQQYQHSMADDAKRLMLSSLPLLADGSTELFSQWSTTSSVPVVQSKLTVSGFGLLEGEFSHSLPADIRDWVLVYGNRVYRPSRTDENQGVLSAAKAVSPRSGNVNATDLKSFLNGTRIVADGSSGNAAKRTATQTITPYRIAGRDPRDVVLMMTFYDSAGGASYVGLQQESLREMELSDTIRLNHAVLIGSMDVPVTELQMDDQTLSAEHSETIVRLLIPVDRRTYAATSMDEDTEP
jgi:hypothetical protein